MSNTIGQGPTREVARSHDHDLHRPGCGKSLARIQGDEIVLLVDSYEDSVETEVTDWTREAGLELDPSYV
jgi:hypothetical protein